MHFCLLRLPFTCHTTLFAAFLLPADDGRYCRL
jgi:hypothetical protein